MGEMKSCAKKYAKNVTMEILKNILSTCTFDYILPVIMIRRYYWYYRIWFLKMQRALSNLYIFKHEHVIESERTTWKKVHVISQSVYRTAFELSRVSQADWLKKKNRHIPPHL